MILPCCRRPSRFQAEERPISKSELARHVRETTGENPAWINLFVS